MPLCTVCRPLAANDLRCLDLICLSGMSAFNLFAGLMAMTIVVLTGLLHSNVMPHAFTLLQVADER